MWDDTSPYLFEPYAARKARLAAERANPPAPSAETMRPVKRPSNTAEIVRRLKAGEPRAAIAQDLGVTKASIRAVARHHGLVAVRIDIAARDAAILAAVETGASYREIAATYGLSRNAVSGIVYRIKARTS